MASPGTASHRILNAVAAAATTVFLVSGLMFAVSAVEARPSGGSVAQAAQCDTDGDGVPDKVIIGDHCPGDPGGPGEPGPDPVPNGPGVETTSLDTCTYPPGELEDRPWEQACMGAICEDNEEFLHFWERDVIWVDGTPTNPGPWRYVESRCDGPEEPGVAEVSAFLVQVLPKGEAVITPPNGRTLVNWETLFYSPTGVYRNEDLNLRGFQVTVEARPVQYTWHFGDGTAPYSTPKQGAAYPEPGSNDIVHRYKEAAEDLQISVDVTYRASFSINGGPMQDIPEDIPTTGSPTVGLDVTSGLPVIVG